MAVRIALIVVSLGLAGLKPASAQADCNSLKPYVVRIEAGPHTAAGLVVGLNGTIATILTAYHVVQDATQIQVSFWSAQGRRETASLASYFADLDLAMLNVQFAGAQLQPLFIEEDLAANERVTTIGHPTGVSWQCGNEIATRISVPEYPNRFLVSSPVIQPGLSGGPIFNDEGELLGIATERGPSGNEFAVRIKQALTGINWNVPTNLVIPTHNPNSILGFRVVNNGPSYLGVDVDYRYGFLSQFGPASISVGPLDNQGRSPQYTYTPGIANEANGTVRAVISASTGDITTTALKICMYAGRPTPAKLLCRTLPYRKLWSLAATTRVTDIKVQRLSAETVQISVTYTYDMPEDPNGPSLIPNVSLIPFILRKDDTAFEFSSNDVHLSRGTNTAIMRVNRIKPAGPTDAIKVCFLQSQGSLFGCLSVSYVTSW